MTHISPDTLLTWRELLLTACQALANTQANALGVTTSEVWDYEEWVWEGNPRLSCCTNWGHEVRTLAGNLLTQLERKMDQDPLPALSPSLLVPSAFEVFLEGVLGLLSELEATEAASFTELGDVLPLVRLLVQSHRLVGRAHKYINRSRPCRKGPTRVSSAYILPVINAMVQEMALAASHLAQPCHTAPGTEWRSVMIEELCVELLEREFESSWKWYASECGSEQSYGSPPSSPVLSVGGRCGMFSPPDTLEEGEEEEETGGAAPSGGLPRTPVLQQRGPTASSLSFKASKAKGRHDTEEAKQEAEAMAASDLFGSMAVENPVVPLDTSGLEAKSSDTRLNSLEAKVTALTDAVQSLLDLAQAMRGPSPPTETKPPQPKARVESGAEVLFHQDEGQVPDREQSGTAAEVTALKLRQDRRKERVTVLKIKVPWAKHLALLDDRTASLQPALHRMYGPSTYHHVGEIGALAEAVKMYRTMSHPSSGTEATGTHLPFKFTAAVALALVHFRVGGPMRDDDQLYLRTYDLIPLADGEDRLLAYINEGMFAIEPSWADRRIPLNMAAFRDCGLRMAYFLGLHWGQRCRHELTITVEALHDKGARSPSIMTPAMACHLLDLLILSVVEAVYEEATGQTPLPVGTDPLTPSQCEDYYTKGWSTDGPTFIASMQSAFMKRWWYEPLHDAAFSDSSRRAVAMRLMGIDHHVPKPPKGGPTGGGDDLPSGRPSPSPSPVPRTNFTVEDAATAASCLPGSRAANDQVCMRFLSVKGCQRGSKCRFLHVGITATQLRDCSLRNSTLQRILAIFGGPSSHDLTSQPTRASTSTTAPQAPQAGRSGGTGDSSDSDSSSDDGLSGPLASGGKASGGVDVQVAYLLPLGGCYRRAPRDDARSASPSLTLQRPSTVHPDAPVQVFNGAADLACVSPPALAPLRAGRQLPATAVSVSPTRVDGRFTVSLGSLVIHGQDAGQELTLGTRVISNACVVLSFATILQVTASDLFSHLVTEAQSAATFMGHPSRVETPTVALMRSFCHDIVASCDIGHPLDALVLLYFPPPALLHSAVVVLHTQDSSVALDVLRGPLATPSTPLLGCLQRRGTPGHMQPLSFPPFTLSDLEHWACDHKISIRILHVQPWQDWLTADPAGPSVSWSDHRICDFCKSPRFPVPPVTL